MSAYLKKPTFQTLRFPHTVGRLLENDIYDFHLDSLSKEKKMFNSFAL